MLVKRKNTELTEKQKAEREARSIFNRRRAGFKRTIKTETAERGLRHTELILEFLEQHPTTKLPKEYFSHPETVSIYKDAITEYKDGLPKSA